MLAQFDENSLERISHTILLDLKKMKKGKKKLNKKYSEKRNIKK